MTEKKIPSELGTQPVGKLLKQYALPSIIAMLASSLYNIVDSIFIGHGVDALALSGLAVTFPLMITGACLVLTFLSRKSIYPWLISVFSLVIPVLLLVTNIYPA
jgi:Na+-driven multidrug efflux pump